MFEGFTRKQVQIGETTINLVVGGKGEPVLLLHGYPQTHFCWHTVASPLAEKFTVVCTDLRGCGASGKPVGDVEHFAYSKRRMAQDQVETMRNLGYEKFAVAGHDRGARVAHRLALDHEDCVTKLALLDIVPTLEAFEMTNQEIATAAYNWFMSIQPDGLPEKLIGSNAKFFLNYCLTHWAGENFEFDAKAVAEYERAFNEEMIRATNEEFRAAASIDLDHDRADSDKKIRCPTLVLWSAQSMWAKYDVLKIWRERAVSVNGKSFDCGHFLPEEKSQETAAELMKFLS